jgi:SagB-type dehydrogenase family enzyme
MTMDDDAPLFDDFWEASSLTQHTLAEFGRRLNTFDAEDKELFLEYPEAPSPLPARPTLLGWLARRRVSQRAFSDRRLTDRDLGTLLASLRAWGGPEHRAFPSAGASYAVEAFVVGFQGSPLAGRAAYYDPERHGLVGVSDDVPPWRETRKAINVTVEGTPALLVVLVVFPERLTAKYGERGGRFALLEAGAAMQQLSLATAESRRLRGVVVGGLLDDYWMRALRLRETNARAVVGYLVGRSTTLRRGKR